MKDTYASVPFKVGTLGPHTVLPASLTLFKTLCKIQVQVQVQDLFVTYTIIQRVYNQQWNVSQVRSMDSANIIEYNTKEVYIKWNE